jgi:hypothetical protein
MDFSPTISELVPTMVQIGPRPVAASAAFAERTYQWEA